MEGVGNRRIVDVKTELGRSHGAENVYERGDGPFERRGTVEGTEDTVSRKDRKYFRRSQGLTVRRRPGNRAPKVGAPHSRGTVVGRIPNTHIKDEGRVEDGLTPGLPRPWLGRSDRSRTGVVRH